MKNNQLVCGLILLGGASFSGVALADHGHGGHGGFELSIGVPFYASPYYSYPYGYYPPPSVVMPAQPQVYIQQDNPPPAPQASNFWYHCNQPEGYYPYVKECPAGWQKVSPTPPGSN